MSCLRHAPPVAVQALPAKRCLRAASTVRRQNGAATLVVVMILFFILAMMAAFANRNLVFEQRVASNYFRAATAFETAEAGAEWALALLNSDRINNQCLVNAAGAGSFAQRYLSIDDKRLISPVNAGNLQATCIRSGAGWVCTCPGAGDAAVLPVVDASTELQPTFKMTIGAPVVKLPAGIAQVYVDACTDSVASCGSGEADASQKGLGRSRLAIQVALLSALKTPPATPLTVRGDVSLDGADLGLHNTNPTLSGLVLQAGGVLSVTGTPARIETVPGTPYQQAVISEDPSLHEASNDRMFAMFFGMVPARYRTLPSVREVACAGDCSAALAAAIAAGTRQIWVNGPLTISSTVDLGSASNPVVLISDGEVTINGALRLWGALYARGNAVWANGSGQQALLTGALLSEGSWQSSGRIDLVYDAGVINILNNQTGSFARVPGSWNPPP